jgi:ubiquinone/menaquinone biosynthesis C-methylase UbiE
MNSKGKVLDTRKYEQMIHDAGASDYDRAIVSEYGMKHKYFTTAIWAKKFDEPFLDYGCGTGIVSTVLSKMNREVVAFDISTKMAAITKNKVPGAPQPTF